MQLANVRTTSPLAVRIHGATVNTPVDSKGSTVPTLSATGDGDEVLVDVVQGRLIVLMKVVAA